MPYLTLTLSGLPIDLPADAAVALSYRANDLRQLDSREAAFSEQFTLPITARNVAALGAPHALDSQTTAPYRLLPAVLTSPGGTELLRGFAILEAAGEGYEVTLTDAVGGLFAQVAERPLRTLDLSAYDHTYSLANTVNGQYNTYQQGYTYALADNGSLFQRDPALGLLWYEMVHAVYYHAVLKAIIAAALPGYRLTGSLLTDARYQAAVLPRALATPQLREATLKPYAVQVLTTANQQYSAQAGTKNYPLIPFQQQTAGGPGQWNGSEFVGPAYPVDVRVSAHLLVRLDATNVPSGAAVRAVAAVRIVDSTDPAAVSIHEQIVYDGINWPQAVQAQPKGYQSFDFDFTVPYTPASRRYAVQLRLENGAGLTVATNTTMAFSIGPRTYPTAPVQLEATLPALSRADFLKLLFNQFNVVFQADANAKTARFDLFNDLEVRRSQAVDWSNKIDFQARPRVVYRLGDYAQRNTFAYAPPPPEYATVLLGAPLTFAPATGTLPVANKTLLPLSATYEAPVFLPLAHPSFNNSTSLCWFPQVIEADNTHPAQPYNPSTSYVTGNVVTYGGTVWKNLLPSGTSVTGSAPQRGLVTVRISGGGSLQMPAWDILPYTDAEKELFSCALVVPAPSTVGLLAHADAPDTNSFAPANTFTRAGLSFDTLLSKYHEGLRRALNPCRVISLPLRLTPLDIAALDFTRPVSLNVPHVPGYGQIKGLFYLNDIDQFQPGHPAPVLVTLLALGESVLGLAPAVSVPTQRPNGAGRRTLQLESGAPVLLESAAPIYLES